MAWTMVWRSEFVARRYRRASYGYSGSREKTGEFPPVMLSLSAKGTLYDFKLLLNSPQLITQVFHRWIILPRF